MPVYLLDESGKFPPPELAEPSGLIAVGGDLGTERLLRAYREGIFPWYSEGDPILWFSPDPRAVLDPRTVRKSRSVRRALAMTAHLDVTADSAFEQVIERCATAKRSGQDGTWITREMRAAYMELHRKGYAHSVEAWHDGQLVGGVYGVGLGGYFAGESMFHEISGASLRALLTLLAQLRTWGFTLFDCQMHTPHVGRIGSELWPRARFLAELRGAVLAPARGGTWHLDSDLLL